MLISDVYGPNMPIEGLQGHWEASSFGKVANDHTTKGEDINNVYKNQYFLYLLT